MRGYKKMMIEREERADRPGSKDCGAISHTQRKRKKKHCTWSLLACLGSCHASLDWRTYW